ncbi:hypothetical protein ACIQVC_22635 [Streptomyces sp. NPDC101112]|uniref:hypothetical protein n=1 Tax=Streptomyces sp. NPDC101112 TaxID=3366105 RepID=UPI0038270B89
MSELGARASGQGRVFQTSGDQYIQEHHHHYGAGADEPLFAGGPQPAAALPAALVENREWLTRWRAEAAS